MTDCVGSLIGSEVRWIDRVVPRQEIDADAIIEQVIDKAGLEVI